MSHSAVMLFLKMPATAFGVTAPFFIWTAAWCIFAGTLACLVRLWWVVRREEQVYQEAQTQLATLRRGDDTARRDGIPSRTYEAIAQIFTQRATITPALGGAWCRFAAQIVVQRDTSGQERFWSPESAENTFNEAAIIEPRLNRSFFTAIPGLATGAGLLCTFIAILLSLLDVTLENEQFRGLDMLISGLSGKFLSSIAALFVATLYIFCEKRLLPRLGQGVHALGVALDTLVPRLTSTALLVSMHERLQAQESAWHTMRSDLGSAIQQGIDAGMGPAFAHLVQSVDDLTSGYALRKRNAPTPPRNGWRGSCSSLEPRLRLLCPHSATVLPIACRSPRRRSLKVSPVPYAARPSSWLT